MNLGKWITNGTTRPFYARREIQIEKPLSKATAYVCGLGQFNFFLDGEKVEEHILDPGWTNYRKRILYVPFDLTQKLSVGRHVIGAEVGNGWYIMEGEGYSFHFPPFMPPNPNPYRPYGESLVLNLALELCYADGSCERICSDERFRVHAHCVTMSNVFGSETTDGRLRQENWCRAGFDDTAWAQAQLVRNPPSVMMQEQRQPPVQVIKSYEGRLLHRVNGRDIYDFSQNMSGIFELELRGKRGTRVDIYPAEKLGANGDVDQMAKNWLLIDSRVSYIIGRDDTWETMQMTFTYFAGRYAAVTFSDCDEKPELRVFRAHAITSAHKPSGSFRCDDKRYEQIYDLVEKAVEANMLSVHTDCPTIERFAWQEPNHLMAPSIMFMKDCRLLWEKFLTDLRYDQHTKHDFFYDLQGREIPAGDGLIPAQSPCYIPNVLPVPGMGSFYDIIPWGSTIILGTYWHYMFYGDIRIIEDNYDAGMRYLAYLKTKVNAQGFLNHGLGDWGNPREGMLARENIETAFLYADAKTLAQFAQLLGRDEDVKALQQYADTVKEHYNSMLLIEHNGVYCYRTWEYQDKTVLTQAGQALPLYWGMVPQEHIDDVLHTLTDIIEQDGSFLCGEVSQPYVIQTLREHGMHALICRLICKPEHPSYYAFVLDGMTTLGEYWETNPRSHCHDMMGHIIEWYYNGIAGIQLEAAGFKSVTIKPYLPESMQQFHARFDSANGIISVNVEESEEEICVTITIDPRIAMRFDDTYLTQRGKPVTLSLLRQSS